MSRTREELEEAAKRVLSEGALPLAKLCKRIPVERRGKWDHLSAGALITTRATAGARSCRHSPSV